MMAKESLMEATEILLCLKNISTKDDYSSFKELYQFYFFRLLHFCISIVHEKETAEEIVNDVFVHLWKKRDNLINIKNPNTYLYVAVKNKSLDYLKANHLLKKTDISEVSNDQLQFTLDPEQLMITKEMKRKISDAINELPPRCKLIFKLIKEDGLKYKEVAATLDISVKTVEAQLTISIKKLASLLLVSPNGRKNHTIKV